MQKNKTNKQPPPPTPDLQEMEVVLRVQKLLHLTAPAFKLSDFQLQLCDEPLRPQLCCLLLPLDHLHQLGLPSLHEVEHSGKDLQTLYNIPL